MTANSQQRTRDVFTIFRKLFLGVIHMRQTLLEIFFCTSPRK